MLWVIADARRVASRALAMALADRSGGGVAGLRVAYFSAAAVHVVMMAVSLRLRARG